MNSKWISDLPTKEEKEEFKQYLREQSRYTDKLVNILERKLRDVQEARRSLKSYTFQSWPEYQADRNATERTILEILKLLDFGE